MTSKQVQVQLFTRHKLDTCSKIQSLTSLNDDFTI